MFELDVIEKKGTRLIDSKLLHKKLEVASYHKDWIRRRIENYGFEEGIDYYLFDGSKMSTQKREGRGGVSHRKDYLLTFDMAKELSMLENNEIGKEARKYFIRIEKDYYSKIAQRAISIESRKELTDVIKDSGENERMHGHGYSTYTNFVYDLVGLKDKFKFWKLKSKAFRDDYSGNFRDYITPDELEKVKRAESIIKPLLELDKQYSEIKKTLEPLFKIKEIK